MRYLLLFAMLTACGDTAPRSDRDVSVPADLADAANDEPDVAYDAASVQTDADAPDAGPIDMPMPTSGWSDRASLPAPQQEVAVVALDGLVYVMGGFGSGGAQLARVNVYDPATDSWSGRADFPTPANHMNAVVFDGKIWVTGFLHMGFSADGRTFVYDPADDSWSPGPDLPNGRDRGASAVGLIDGKIYVAGGVGIGGTQAYTDVLDPVTQTWTSLADAPRDFDHAGYGVIDGKLIVAAGRDGSIASFVDGAHAFDPQTGEWTDVAPILTARGGVASAVHDGKLYVFGGEGDPNSPGRVFPQAEVWDAASDTWSALEPMPHPRHGLAAAVVDGVIYLPGGAPTEFLDATDIHDVYVP